MAGSTILLVDDDEVLRQVLCRVLMRDGYAVVEAGSVEEALQRGGEQPPALALIDLRLPDGDGVELAEQLAKQVGSFPLILMTAYPLRLRDQPELARPFTHVLTKPLNLDELRQAIETSLAANGAATVRERTRPGEPRPSEPRPSGSRQETRSLTVAAPPAAVPTKTSRRRWVTLSVLAVVVAGLAVVVPALGTPAFQRFLKRPAAPLAAPVLQSHARLVANHEDEIELPREVVERLGVTSEPVQTAVAPRPLELAGSLSFDPTRLGRVQARFAGEVIRLGTIRERDTDGIEREREFRYGDPVHSGELLAIVLSKDLGEKKSELVDALVRLWFDEAQLEKFDQLVTQGSLPPITLMNQQTVVATDRNAIERVQLTLRTWDVPEEDINAVKDEARQVYARKGRRDVNKEKEWAKVRVRAPFDGTIVERNVNLHNIVNTDFDLFKVADLRKLGVLVHAYEEDMRELRGLPRGFPWKVRTGADVNGRPLKSDGLQQLGLVVDPNQHTDPVMGRVDNAGGSLRVGQFIKATVDLPAPPNVVSVPVSAIEEDGDDSIVFVQPDPAKPRFVRRRVAVAMRLREVVYVRSALNESERKKGLREVQPGEFIVTEGVLELQSALEDLQAKAKAQK
jgi:cobalt-zinc-cadmium efflux system membrane fusion protein